MKLIIIAGIIFGPLVIMGLIKLFKKNKKTVSSVSVPLKPKKSWFWLSIQVVILLWLAFGIYLFAKWYFFPSKQIEKIAQKQSVSAKPKEKVWDWTFKWERNDKQWEEAKSIGRKKKGEVYPARILEITQSKIIMEYVSGYSGNPEEVTLKVGDTGDFWATDYFVKNKNPKKIDLSLKISLHKDPESQGDFAGIFWQDQDSQQVNCWLSKK